MSSSIRLTHVQKFLLIVVATLVVLCGSGVALFYTLGRSASSGPHENIRIITTQTATPVITAATAQANIPATATTTAQTNIPATAATARANTPATATTTAQTNIPATAAAQARIQATAGVIQTATVGQSQQVFNDLNAQWQNDGTNCSLNNGYYVKAGVGQAQFCRELGDVFQNVAITVDMVSVSGYSAGLLFRVQGKNANNVSYFFEIGTGGNYQVIILGVKVIQNWTISPAIKQGNGSLNKLEVITNGSNLYFYVNGAYLMHVTDSSYLSGGLGFACYANQTSPCEAVFSNLNVY
jgi:hypothetical protein